MTRLFLASLLSSGLTACAGKTVVDLPDPRLDDYGPGNYLYPPHPNYFRQGVFDLRRVRIQDEGRDWLFQVWIQLPTPEPVELRSSPIKNVRWEQEIYFQNFDFYLRFDDAPAEARQEHAVPGRNFDFAPGHEWDQVVVFTPYPYAVQSLLVDWPALPQMVVPGNVKRVGPRFQAQIPKSQLASTDPSQWSFVVVLTGAIPQPIGTRRADNKYIDALTMPVRPNPGTMNFAGADLSPYNPNVIDLLAPTAEDQEKALAPDDSYKRTKPVELTMTRLQPSSSADDAQ